MKKIVHSLVRDSNKLKFHSGTGRTLPAEQGWKSTKLDGSSEGTQREPLSYILKHMEKEARRKEPCYFSQQWDKISDT